ncbi:MAG: threonine-phosphate decarboxylase CobD [Candidatus Binatia bacterium]|nr:threonine-phosphate decarboxylase CobD [Candidatus Binatia bacterium]
MRRGYDELCPRSRGILNQEHGGAVYAFARMRGIAPEAVLDFSASINPLGWPPALREAYRAALARIVHYPEPYAESLTAELARYHGIDPAAILVGNGSTQWIYLLPRVCAARRVLLLAPLFSEYERAFRLSGARVERLCLHPPRFTVSSARLQQALRSGYSTLVLSNPNSPTGSLLPQARGEEIVRLCQRTGTQLIVDETFVDWCESESLKQHACRSRHVVVLRSFTKFFALPGLRVGYVIAHPQVIQRFRRQLEPWAVNSVAQEVARACLRDRRFIQRSRAFMVRERAWLFQQLTRLAGVEPFPSQANFVLARVTANALDAVRLAHLLAEQHLLIRPCDNFPGLDRQFFRAAVRTRRENRRLVAALRKALETRSPVHTAA